MKRSGDLQKNLTAEARRGGEEHCQIFTTETRRQGENPKNSGFSDHLISRSFSAPPRLRGEIRFSDHPITRDHPGSPPSPILAWWGGGHPITRFIRLLRAALREIFDETAYDRFLVRTNALRSVASYRDFMQEREAAMVKKPRCC
jgi:hypothetical protein